MKKIEITIETHRVTVIHPTGGGTGWCAECGAAVEWLTVEAAAAATGWRDRTLYQAVERGQVHFYESATGALRLCVASVQQLLAESAGEFQSNLQPSDGVRVEGERAPKPSNHLPVAEKGTIS